MLQVCSRTAPVTVSSNSRCAAGAPAEFQAVTEHEAHASAQQDDPANAPHDSGQTSPWVEETSGMQTAEGLVAGPAAAAKEGSAQSAQASSLSAQDDTGDRPQAGVTAQAEADSIPLEADRIAAPLTEQSAAAAEASSAFAAETGNTAVDAAGDAGAAAADAADTAADADTDADNAAAGGVDPNASVSDSAANTAGVSQIPAGTKAVVPSEGDDVTNGDAPNSAKQEWVEDQQPQLTCRQAFATAQLATGTMFLSFSLWQS